MNVGEKWVLGAWLTTVAGVTVRGVSRSGGLPQPNSYIAAGVVFTMLFGLASVAPGLGGVLAVGTALGVLAAPYFQNKPNSGVLATLTDWLNKINPPTAQQTQQQGQQAPTAPAGK